MLSGKSLTQKAYSLQIHLSKILGQGKKYSLAEKKIRTVVDVGRDRSWQKLRRKRALKKFPGSNATAFFLERGLGYIQFHELSKSANIYLIFMKIYSFVYFTSKEKL